jgi:hypothetical protein
MTKRLAIKVSKTDAAKRQLDTAIRLWLDEGDSVSIHTLAAAAHQIVHDLGKKRGVTDMLRALPGTGRSASFLCSFVVNIRAIRVKNFASLRLKPKVNPELTGGNGENGVSSSLYSLFS